ncbi:MAG: AI-2E family transporter [Proteobacteria bacterium]|nr:AI-2E family transporter [Pseudomonadota bacterium]MDA1021881.1 AI-2E family transporter [Pseudomonadota bacterium]
MSLEKQSLFWLIGLAIFLVLLNALSSVLMPFVAGMAIAYCLDPVADWLENRGASRAMATTLIVGVAFVLAVGGMILLFPVLQAQVVSLATLIPGLIDTIRDYLKPLLERLKADLPPDALEHMKTAVGNYAGTAMKWFAGLIGDIWRGGIAFFNVLSLLVITPVVAFYLLRDWDLIVKRLDSYLPIAAAAVIREQIRAIDATIAGFVRGQAIVCMVLAFFYAIGLTLVGLKSGMLVGIGAGAISFIPYLGAATGLCIGVAIALAQFSDWMPVAIVALIFIIGQTAESYILTPRLVGDRIGLHPVWIIFALMAGGALFGFTGVLLAVPVAAIIGVLLRFGLGRYKESPLFLGKQ